MASTYRLWRWRCAAARRARRSTKPGSAESSLLVAKIVSGLMPPGKKLAPEEIATIRQWIDQEKPLRAGITEADVIPTYRDAVCHLPWEAQKQEGGSICGPRPAS